MGYLVWTSYYTGGNFAIHIRRRGSFWWKDVLKLFNSFKYMASVTVVDGSICLFWSDTWHGHPFSAQWPHLLSYAQEKHILVQEFMAVEDKSDFFHIPLSVEAHDQYQLLLSELEGIQLNQIKDKWSYIWGSNFASSKAYKQLLGSILVPPIYNWLWNSSCLPKRNVFFWLAIKDRLSTRGLLKRRNMELQSYNCVLCHLDIEESLNHLFLECPFVMSC